MYCNTIYFGEGALGIGAAARTLLNVSDLTLANQLISRFTSRWPSNYNPTKILSWQKDKKQSCKDGKKGLYLMRLGKKLLQRN